jgi:hypothetical protein
MLQQLERRELQGDEIALVLNGHNTKEKTLMNGGKTPCILKLDIRLR